MTARRDYEAPDLTVAIERLAKALVKRAAEGDREAFSSLADAERILHDSLTKAVAENRAGSNAYSWTEIGDELGITRQTAQARFGKSCPAAVRPTGYGA